MKANTPLELLAKNTKDIKELKEKIAPLYKCVGDLGTATASIALALTNVGEATTGFLIDSVGNIYKINANDGYNLLLEYYSTIKGATGATGDTGATGARGFSIRILNISYNIETHTPPYLDETILLSDIINQEELQINDVVLYLDGVIGTIKNITSPDVIIENITPLEIGGGSDSAGCYLLNNAENLTHYIGAQYDGELWQIDNRDNYPLKSGDILLGDDNYIYKIASVNLTNETFRCFKIREIGKSTFTHHISLVKDRYNYILLEIVNDNTTPIDTETALKDYLTENGFLMSTPKLAVGYAGGNRTTGIYCELNQLFRNTGADMGGVSIDIENYTITDTMV